MEKGLLVKCLGRIVTVDVDRPLGTCHPKYPGMVYPVNYGYIRGVLGGDGEAQDCYILGVDHPVRQFTGRIVAVAHRKDDLEDKWVVAPKDMVVYQPEISRTLDFQEQWFDTEYFCLYEKVCGSVLYTTVQGERKYLLVRNLSGHVGFPKGHMEGEESEGETAHREILEETGLDIPVDLSFRESYRYLYDGYVQKDAVYFLNAFSMERIQPQEGEILRYWLVNCQQALELLNFPQDRAILQKAESYLNQREREKSLG